MSALLRTLLSTQARSGTGRSLTASIQNGRTPAYRRLRNAYTTISPGCSPGWSPISGRLSNETQSASSFISLRSAFLPNTLVANSSHPSRSLSSSSRLLAKVGKPPGSDRVQEAPDVKKPEPEPEPQPQPKPERSAEDAGKASSGEAGAEAGAEGAKSRGQSDSQEGSQEGEAGEGSEKKEKKQEAPPPPHGDKSPWQVFTETLQSEFKASKEWNESTKQLGGRIDDFRQNETLKRARSGFDTVTGVAGTTTSKVFKTTGRAIGQTAAWTWDTMPVKGLRATANVTGRGLEKVTRPIRQTEAFKSVANVIDDGSSSRYGGWTEREERKMKREAREEEEIRKGLRPRRTEPLEEDPDAGTNVTLHKDAAWKEQWRVFRDESKLMQGFFSMKSAYNESENPLITTARSISDRVAGFFAENETAMVIKKFREMDPNFQLEPFLQDMREYILPEVLDAYVKADVETLGQWLSAAQFQVYTALMHQYTTNGLKSDGKILDIRNVDIVSARMLDPGEIPVFILSCRTQEIHVYRNAKSGELAAGMEDRVQQVTYAIGVTRIPEDVNNAETRGWRIIELQKSARDFI